MSDGELRIRPAVRALIQTPEHDVLLVRFEFPTRSVWALPGGGIDAGETALEALCRELREELGHEVVESDLGPHVWNRLHVIPFPNGEWDGQREQVHLLQVPQRFDPQPQFSWDQLRAENLHEMRWWSLEEIVAATDVTFVPGELPTVLRRLVDEGAPKVPWDVGV